MSKGQRGSLIFVCALAAAIIFCGVIPLGILPKNLGLGMALPVIQLPGEVLIGTEEAPTLTNTLLATLITDVLVLTLIFSAGRNLKDVPGRLQNLFEIIVEALMSLARSVAGDQANHLFPMMATLFIFILVANWMGMVPGVDSVGIMHCAKPGMTGYDRQGVLLDVREPMGGDGQVATEADYHACEALLQGDAADAAHEDANADTAEAATEDTTHEATAGTPLYVVTPYLRAAATDLNFTFGLAIIVMIAVQYYGVKALGVSYFSKFINVFALGDLHKKPMGVVDFLVGIIEIMSEFGKVVSLAFRLFGNIFAGQLLLFIMAFLLAWILPVAVYGLEMFVGAIQAFVFAMLFLVFSADAMVNHHEDDEHH